MTTSKITDSKKQSSIIWLIILSAIFIISLIFVAGQLRFFTLDPEILGRYWEIKWWLYGHIASGILALLIGPFQFWNKFRISYAKAHRRLGKTYLISILIGVISCCYLAWATTATDIHWTFAVSLQCLGILWFFTALMAYRAIRQRRIQIHKEWMIRSYIITFAFVTFRALLGLGFAFELGNLTEIAPTAVWLSWTIPLFTTEIILQWNKK